MKQRAFQYRSTVARMEQSVIRDSLYYLFSRIALRFIRATVLGLVSVLHYYVAHESRDSAAMRFAAEPLPCSKENLFSLN